MGDFVERIGLLAEEGFGADELLEFEERYLGEYESLRHFAEQYAEDVGLQDRIPDAIGRYFDYEAYGRDLMVGGEICEHDGYYFSRN